MLKDEDHPVMKVVRYYDDMAQTFAREGNTTADKLGLTLLVMNLIDPEHEIYKELKAKHELCDIIKEIEKEGE